MSQRVKKPGKVDDNNGKRRRRRPSSDGEEGTQSGSNSGGNGTFPSLGGMWTPRHLNDLKVSSIYNRNSAEAPAELYRKDLISAMKLADSEPLTPEEYWLITDPWKQEWEKGVQVPVNPESLPEPEVVVISPVNKNERSHDFRLPKKKYIRVTHDDFFNPDYHQLVSTAARAEKVCSYDLDDIDASWLSCANSDRGMQTLPVISEFLMEQVIEELELQCWEQVQTILKSQEGLGIEYDENVICDVCRSPESEEGNEMVFCDSCNICVHQACYGITTIPSGSWLCRTCTLGIRPACVLCPNMGGAMKATRSGQKWAHVACAIWIPEVSIGSVEKMEPITKISAIPQSRWSLICVLCKDKAGACIQCSVKTCKTAYHVTCAFKNGLEMKPIIVDENAEDGIKLRSYCQKHSVNTKKDKANSGSEEDMEKKKIKAMTAEERNQARAEKLQQIESEFYKYVRLKDVAQNLAVDMDIVMLVYNYWKLKRKSLNNRPLVPPRPETTQLLTQQQEQDLEQMKMFVQLRQDLERVRNLCYMVSRREKLSRTYFKLREQTFQKQVALLGEKSVDSLNPEEKSAILSANHGPSIYDQIYSFENSSTNNALKDYDTLVSLIAGEDRKDKLVNGVIKTKKSSSSAGLGNMINSSSNSFKKQFVNGARKKNLIGECFSLSESEASVSDAAGTGGGNSTTLLNKKKKMGQGHSSGRKPLSYLFDSDSSADGGEDSRVKDVAVNKGKKPRKQQGKSPPISRGGGRGGGQKAGGKKSSTSDSDDLELHLPVQQKFGKSEGPIYSDSESDGSLKRRPGSPVATKAAVKEFTRKTNNNRKALQQQGATGQKATTTTTKQQGPKGGRKKKGSAEPAEQLIVPQREAAKKATESIRTVKPRRDGLIIDPATGQELPFVSSPAATLNDRESESFEKTAMEKFKDIAAASVQDKQIKKRNDKSNNNNNNNKRGSNKKSAKLDSNLVSTNSKEEELHGLFDELRDQYEFDCSNDSKNVPNFVPQRQAAKKAAEHIRSGLSNIVAARLIIEDEMEATTTNSATTTTTSTTRKKNNKGDKTASTTHPGSPGTPSITGTMITGGKKPPNRGTRGKSPFHDETGEDSSLQVGDASSKPRSRKRVLPTKDDKGTVKSGRNKESTTSASSEVPAASDHHHTDWPFLDSPVGQQNQRQRVQRGQQSKTSQSACRRSRERSSSSSSSSSSGSSSSGSSSSRSSASSSASASPESIASPRKASSSSIIGNKQPIPNSNILLSSTTTTTSRGPSRKLKTSDRNQTDGGPSNEIIAGKKPAPKNRGPGKFRSRGAPVGSAHSNQSTTPLLHPTTTASGERSDDDLHSRRHTKVSDSRDSSSSSSDRRSLSPPSSSSRVAQKNNKLAQTKGKRGKRESPSTARGGEKEKNFSSKLETISTSPSKSNAKSQAARASSKALLASTKATSGGGGGLELSSDSENDVRAATTSSSKTTSPDKNNSQILSSSDPRNLRATARAKKKGGVSNLSDSDSELVEEKENSCRVPPSSDAPISESPSTNTRNRTPKQGMSHHHHSTAASILSPLTPSSENKEKELKGMGSSSLAEDDHQPEAKRARISSETVDTCGNGSSYSARFDSGVGSENTNQVPVGPNSGPQLFSSTSATSAGGGGGGGALLSAKSLFSPRASGHENDLVDFDSELYDLARSVSADYSQVDEEGGAAASSLPFFSQSFLSREEVVEDSPHATLNLVEKLRLQHARKSGCPRSSIDGSDLSLSEEPQKSPTSKMSESSSKPGSSIHEMDEKVCDVSNQGTSSIHPALSPERDKVIEGDERWVPPSNRMEQQQQQTASLHEADGKQQHHHLSNKQPHHQQQQQQQHGSEINNGDLSYENRYKSRQFGEQNHHQVTEQQLSSSHHRLQQQQQQQRENQQSEVMNRNEKSSIETHNNKSGDGLHPLSVSLTSPIMSPLSGTSPSGVKQGHSGSQSVLYAQQHSSGGPHSSSSSSSSFMYPPHSGASSMQNPNDPNNPRASFFRSNNQQVPPPNQKHQPTSSSSLSPGHPRQNFSAGAQHFLQQQQQQHGKQQQSGKEITTSSSSSSTGIPPTSSASSSPSVPLNQRRTSTPFMDENSISDSISSVTSGMLPLAKPSIASPSMILAANNVKNITPPPPPQSTVAQIIENVVNNHANNSSMVAQELLNVMLGLSQSQSMLQATSSDNNSCSVDMVTRNQQQKAMPSSSTIPNVIVDQFKPSPSIVSDNTQNDNMAEYGTSTTGKRNKSAAAAAVTSFHSSETDPTEFNSKPIETSSGKSPRGRGRRATTPRGPAKNEKILTNCETNGVKPRGRSERKSTAASTSPARAKAPTTPGRGRGRGKGRGGKGLVATRKDLAGTVYDIDFDEFEENVDEKLDLRSLRERRKSSEVHTGESKSCKSERSRSPSGDSRLGSFEISSPKYKETTADSNNLRMSLNLKTSIHQMQQQQQTTITNENVVPPSLQPPLPGPVDMRTYNSGIGGGGGSLLEISQDNRNEKQLLDHSRSRDVRGGGVATDISSIFSSGSNEIDDLDETFEVLSTTKDQIYSTTNTKGIISQTQIPIGIDPAIIRRQNNNADMMDVQSVLASRESSMDNTDFSRNQLKVKIKGPFLDANYGSHSLVVDPGGVPHYQNSLHHHHLPVGPSQIVNVPASNTSNLRRMRKKELLRQYWNQDMNMDGSSCGPSHDAEMSHSSMVHRSVITIPKAVASMAIIPTKDDYRESLPHEETPFPSHMTGMQISAAKGGAAEKRKRNRGIREMAALGIITCDSPRERRRDRADSNLPTPNYSSEVMGKKRGKANKRPIRSTFIPPTLVDSEHTNTTTTTTTNTFTNNEKGKGNNNNNNNNNNGSRMITMGSSSSSTCTVTNASSAVVTAVNHPTPKLKIKFGDLSKGSTSALSVSASISTNHVLSDSSDKEAPNKKAKGRPPKKRGISELNNTAAPPTMEELKRESMKFREMVMQDFAVEERKEILQLHGTRKHKKHRRKGGGGGAASSETDGSSVVGPTTSGASSAPASEVKVIADGSTKLILRFGKGRASVGGNEGGGGGDGKSRETSEEISEKEMEDVGENDSGFTGGSEGSSGSILEIASGAIKERLLPKAAAELSTTIGCPAPLVHIEESHASNVTSITITDPVTVATTSTFLLPESTQLGAPSNNSFSELSKELTAATTTVAPSTSDIKPSQLAESLGGFQSDKIMPIRLKLSRCFEGYSLNTKPENCSPNDTVPAPPPAKQSDSCEVR